MEEGMEYLEQIGIRAKEAESRLRILGTEEKNRALRKAAEYLVKEQNRLLAANGKDMEAARGKGMPQGLLDRLALNEERIRGRR